MFEDPASLVPSTSRTGARPNGVSVTKMAISYTHSSQYLVVGTDKKIISHCVSGPKMQIVSITVIASFIVYYFTGSKILCSCMTDTPYL